MISNLIKKARLDNDKEEYDGAQETQTRMLTIITWSQLRVEISPDPKESRSNQGKISGENSSNRWVQPAWELVKSVTQTNSKMREPKTYNDVINNLLHRNICQKAINEEFWNLDSYETWCYTTLPPNCEPIGCKWIFKTKYYQDRSIERYKARLVA